MASTRDPFSDRTWVVTGAASGIGRAVALALAGRGATVDGWDRTAPAWADAPADAAPRLHGRTIDVTDGAAVAAAFEQVAATDPEGLAGVVHSAGILSTGMFAELPLASQFDLIHINFGGTVSVAHGAVPHLVRTHGSLVLMGSASGFQGPPEYAVYGATKAAVIALAQALRIELEDQGVHVASCNPLFTATPMLGGEERDAALLATMGVQHSAEEVATAIIRGIERRRPMILPGARTRAMRFAGDWLDGLGHPLMRMTWRRARERSGAAVRTPNQGP